MQQQGRIGGAEEQRGASVRDRVIYLVGVFGLAASISVVWLGMRMVMDIGGACASGGAYEIAVPCPPGLDLAMFLAFPLGFLSAGVIVWKGAALGGPWIGVAALAWPALFLGLGWNFLEFALRPPDGSSEIEWGWLVPGLIFMLMGAIPLWLWFASRGGGPIVPGVAGTRARTEVTQLRDLHGAMARASRNALRTTGSGASTMTVAEATRFEDTAAGTEGLVDQLERLARLHRAGSLSLAEFDAAKRALIAAATATDR